MNNHFNILSKQASFDLKCSKMFWLRPRPRFWELIVKGFVPLPLAAHYFTSILPRAK